MPRIQIIGGLSLVLVLASAARPAEAVEPFARLRTIVLDPGHGGLDSGCIGVAGVPEKLLTLTVAGRLRDALLDWDPTIDVVLTRTDDSYPSLEDRTRIANEVSGDVFLSLHFNCAENPLAVGVETFYLEPTGTAPGEIVPGREHFGPALPRTPVGVSGDIAALIVDDLTREGATAESARLAEVVQGALIDEIGTADRGVRQAQFRVLRGARMPANVVELGFLTHERQGKVVFGDAYLDDAVGGLVAALVEFDRWVDDVRFGTHPVLPPATLTASY